VREIIVPIEQVIAIFARENGQGMAFPKPDRPILKQPTCFRRTQRPVIALAEQRGSKSNQCSQMLKPARAAMPRMLRPLAQRSSYPNQASKPTLTRIK
jgi:stringent starvation protein B